MSIEKPANERLELYNRFKQSLKDGSAESEFFDADDLIIIIDQAVDLDDEYVQIEALMRGYRFFPDNEELAARRGFLYYDLNLDAGVENMLANRPDNSPMWDILRLRLSEENIDAERSGKVLDSMVELPGLFDDETVIQLVDCASACGRYDWLKANEARLRKKTDYLPTLLYELFIVADIQNDTDYCLSLLEELTEIEPFNIDFWNALAQTQSNADNIDGALASLDYALAIESDNAPALTLKASILIRREQFAEALGITTQIMESAPTALAAELDVRALYGTGKRSEASQRLAQYCTTFAESRSLIEVALFLDIPEIHEVLDAHFDASDGSDDMPWAEWAREHYVHGHLKACAALLACLRRHSLLDYTGYKMLATTLYCSKSYKQAVELLDDAIARQNGAYLTPDIVIAGMMAAVRCRSKAKCKTLLKQVIESMPMTIKEDWTLSSAIESIGFSNFIGMISMLIDNFSPEALEELDIFKFPPSYSDQEE